MLKAEVKAEIPSTLGLLPDSSLPQLTRQWGKGYYPSRTKEFNFQADKVKDQRQGITANNGERYLPLGASIGPFKSIATI
jgi:hypothetical protein